MVKGVKSFITPPCYTFVILLLLVRRMQGSTTSTEHQCEKRKFIFTQKGMEYSTLVSLENFPHSNLTAMTTIKNSSTAKFLALFFVPALILASGSFNVSSSVFV
tara:strand:+ start:337 stop:648 length:312 start_codon:yes stop_codon:yes gene_type:complete